MIKREKKTSLGMVLTDRYIEAVCLEATSAQKTRIRAGRIALPDGIFCDGRIAVPVKAAAMIRKLLKQEGIALRKATVLIPDTQTVAGILDLPGEMPANIHKYIHTEVRYSPILTKRTPYSDYHTLGADEDGKEKILIGVTSRECIENLIQTFALAGLEILSLEMDFCALYRVIDSRVLSGQKPKHLLLAGTTGQTLTIGVFLNHKLDYIQRFSMPAGADEEKAAVFKQLQTIKQFYEIEKDYSFHQNWKTILVLDTVPQEEQVWSSDLHSLFGDSADFYTPSDPPCEVPQKPESLISFAGYGAALKDLEPASGLAAPELLPRFYTEHYAWKRTARITMAATAVMMTAIYAGTWIFQTFCFAEGKPAEMQTARVVQLANEQKQLHSEIEILRKLRHVTDDLTQQETDFSYSSLLKEIRVRIPAGLQITSLEMSKSGIISLRGRALSFQAIHQFASTLEQSDRIASAFVEENRVSSTSSQIFEYQILCQIRRTERGEVSE